MKQGSNMGWAILAIALFFGVTSVSISIAETQTSTADRNLQGEIVNIDLVHDKIVVRDAGGREWPVILKNPMVKNYMRGDYVDIFLTHDLTEALTVKTRNPDVQGDVLTVDRGMNQLVVKGTDGIDYRVTVRPEMITDYRAGDVVRLYRMPSSASFENAHIIRVS